MIMFQLLMKHTCKKHIRFEILIHELFILRYKNVKQGLQLP